MKPDFIIAGAYRSGTTTLRHWLAAHPEISMPSLAEPSYFAFDESGESPEHLLSGSKDPFGRKRVRAHREYVQLFDGLSGVVGECSPEYLRAPGSAERIASALPDCRIIITLRKPSERLLSDWRMCRRDGAEELPFADAMDAVAGRKAAGTFGGHYLATSMYASGISEFLTHFDRSQVQIAFHEQWITNPAKLAEDIGGFLRVDHDKFTTHLPESNKAGIPTSGVGSALWALRRRAAPHLAQRVPASLKARADARLGRLLSTKIEPADRVLAQALVDDEVGRVEALLGRTIPEWSS